MTSSYTVKKPCNHGFHLIMTVLTLGAWGLFVWPIAAMLGRKETIRHHGYPAAPLAAPPAAQRAPYALPMPQPNAVNPYNGQPYFDTRIPMRPIEYPPQSPVQYGR